MKKKTADNPHLRDARPFLPWKVIQPPGPLVYPNERYSAIYALVDPRHEDVRYIGATSTSLEARLRFHLAHPTNADVDAWLEELATKGLRPEIRPVVLVPPATSNRAETQWIAWCRARGRLLNRDPGGAYRRKGEVLPNMKRIADSAQQIANLLDNPRDRTATPRRRIASLKIKPTLTPEQARELTTAEATLRFLELSAGPHVFVTREKLEAAGYPASRLARLGNGKNQFAVTKRHETNTGTVLHLDKFGWIFAHQAERTVKIDLVDTLVPLVVSSPVNASPAP